MSQWIIDNFKNSFPDQKYAFLGTVNWMKALRVVIKHSDFSDEKIKYHYKNIQRIQQDRSREIKVFENLLMAYHNHASIVAMLNFKAKPYDISRSAIIGWYYSIYFSGSAMIAAQLDENYEAHAKTADVWHKNLVSANLILPPFNYKLDNLVKKEVDAFIEKERNGNSFTIQKIPFTLEQARGAILSYLSGSAGYERWKIELKLIKDNKLENFRKKSAQVIRDKRLEKHGVSFMHQAFRYRGKVNYRDSLFLTYGEDKTEEIEILLEDLVTVSEGFQKMCIGFIKAKLNKDSWQMFFDDLKKNNRLSTNLDFWE
jgi:hypothetical protein